MIFRDSLGQCVTRQVVVLIGPLGGFGNLVRKSCGGENLRQQRVRIQGDLETILSNCSGE
jgi:hypothetical protein